MKIRQADDVLSKQIDGVWVILEDQTGYMQKLNDVAGEIWSRCEKPVEVDVLVKKLSLMYDIDIDEVRKDVEAFVDDYLERGYLVEV